MRKVLVLALATAALSACRAQEQPATNTAVSADAATTAAELSLARLDCGSPTIKNFDAFFSDRPGLYKQAPRDTTNSCYLIRHGDQILLWDTGFPAALKGGEMDMGQLVARLDKTIAEQLAQANLKPADVDILGISHAHADHLGQAALFPQARLVMGAGDIELAKASPEQGGPSPIAPWLQEGAKVTAATGDVDIFGDGSVVALHLPGHTPDHLALLVNLASGPVLLSGDLYHSLDARDKRGVPPFNTSRPQTLASMDKFEALAKARGAKVIIQHEPRDNAKLPAFPEAAR